MSARRRYRARGFLGGALMAGCTLPDTILVAGDGAVDRTSSDDLAPPRDTITPSVDRSAPDVNPDVCDGPPCPPPNGCPDDPGATAQTAAGCPAANASSTLTCGAQRMTCPGTCLRCVCRADVPRVLWARGFSEDDSGQQRQAAKTAAIDDEGNVYVAGRFANVLRDSAGYVSERYGGPRSWVGSFSRTGVRRWLHVLGPGVENTSDNTLLERGGLSTALGADGGLYLAGPLVASVTLPASQGPLTLNATARSLFVARLDTARGEARWLRSLGDAANARVSQLSVAADGDYAVGGSVIATPAWGAAGAGTDAFVRTYRPDGALAWSWRPAGEGDEQVNGVAVGRDVVVVVGEFDQRVDLGDGVVRSVGTRILSSTNGPRSAFIASLARADGRVRWARALGDSTDRFMAVGLDAAQNAYVGAIIGSRFDFAGGAVTSPNGGGNPLNVAVLSYTADGCERWVRAFGGNENDSLMALTAEPDGTVYAGGAACRFFSFGYGEVTGGGCVASFIVSYDRAGAFRWGRRFGARGNGQGDTVFDIAVNRQGTLAVAGGTLASSPGSFLLETFAESQNITAGNAGYLLTLEP